MSAETMTGNPWITHLEGGDHLHGWNHDTGMPGIALFANAVQIWAIAQNRDITVNDAAMSFNVAPDLIRQAADWHYWMSVGAGDIIKHEGE